MYDHALVSQFDRFGEPVTLRQVTGEAYSTATGQVTQTTTDVPIQRAIVGKYDTSEIRGLVEESDFPVVIYAAELAVGVVPKKKDRIVRGTVEAEVIRVTQRTAGTEVLTYTLQCRQESE